MRKKKYINFKTLSKKEIRELSSKWEKEVMIFEFKLQSYINNPKAHPEKIERMWRVANSLWRRVVKLERFKQQQ